MLIHPETNARTVVPVHPGRTLKEPLLRAIVRDANLSVEEFKRPGAPAHHILLGGGTIVIEGLNLRDVEPGPYEMYCLPLRVVGSDGAPARVVLRRS